MDVEADYLFSHHFPNNHCHQIRQWEKDLDTQQSGTSQQDRIRSIERHLWPLYLGLELSSEFDRIGMDINQLSPDLHVDIDFWFSPH